MSAVVHNLPEMAAPLKLSIEECLPEINFDFESFCLIPPKPLLDFQNPLISQNWPLNKIKDEDVLYLQEAQGLPEVSNE
jgi:hypothetical protein